MAVSKVQNHAASPETEIANSAEHNEQNDQRKAGARNTYVIDTSTHKSSIFDHPALNYYKGEILQVTPMFINENSTKIKG